MNRVIDEGILPEGFFTHDDGRPVLAAACTLISFYFESAKSLTSEERLFVIEVHSSSEILGGTPVIQDTRIPVYDVAASAALEDSFRGHVP